MKRFILTFCYAAICLLSFSQIPFDVKSPSWKEFALPIPEDGINIRQSPSVSAPRMMVNEDKIDNYEVPLKYYGYWSSVAPKGNIYPIMLTEAAPIIKEQNGWLQLSGIGPSGSNGWVSGKYCQRLTPQPITMQELKENPQVIVITKDGEDYVLYSMPNEMDQDITIYFGKLSDDMIICPYEFYISYEIEPTTQLKKNEYGVYIMQVGEKNRDEWGCPILNTFPKNVIDTILSNLTKSEKSTYICKINDYFSVFTE